MLHLSDTAGLRESDDVVEAIGIKKALERIDTSSLVLAVLTARANLTVTTKCLLMHARAKSSCSYK